MLGGYIGQSLTAANVTGTVAITNGGTGAITAAAAITNLGALAMSGGTMSGQLSMGGNAITNVVTIRDNQSPSKIRMTCSGTTDTQIYDRNGTAQIDISPNLVTINNSITVAGVARFNGATTLSSTVSITDLLQNDGTSPVEVTGGVIISGFTPTVLYVDGTNGSDANGSGQILNPFQTLAGAVGSASSGDLIFLLPGTYNESASTQIVLPAGVHLKGAGIDVTTIASTNTSAVSPFIVVGNGSVVSDLTINNSGSSANPSCIGALDGNFGLNPSLFRVKAVGGSTGLYYEASATSGTSYLYCEECIFQGSFRAAIASMSPGMLKADFHRCQFIFTYNASVGDSSIGECLFIEAVAGARLFGCVLSMTDTAHTSWSSVNYQAIDSDQPLELYGTHIITNFPNLPAAPLTTTPGSNPGFWALSNTAVTKIGGGCTISPQVSDTNANLYQTLPSLLSHSYPLTVGISSSTATLWGESSDALFEVAVDAATLTSDTLTIANVTATTVPLGDGQKMTLRIKNTNASSTAMTLAFGTTYNNGAFSISMIAAGKRAYLDYIYDADNSKWDLTGYVSGI